MVSMDNDSECTKPLPREVSLDTSDLIQVKVKIRAA
jgi:hypothetical protein